MQHAHHPGRWVAALALAALSLTRLRQDRR